MRKRSGDSDWNFRRIGNKKSLVVEALELEEIFLRELWLKFPEWKKSFRKNCG